MSICHGLRTEGGGMGKPGISTSILKEIKRGMFNLHLWPKNVDRVPGAVGYSRILNSTRRILFTLQILLGTGPSIEAQGIDHTGTQ